jgi:protoporphyrinogen oxidase
MNVAVIGAGLLGLQLARKLTAKGHQVSIFEASPFVGGLSAPHDYGSFVHDRFYHVILPQDLHTLSLIEELGLRDQIQWSRARTGYSFQGRIHPMNGLLDYLFFPALSFFQKLRLGLGLRKVRNIKDPSSLYEQSAKDWLTKLFGTPIYQRFWAPLLRAKFGSFADTVAAVFLHATMQRLLAARSGLSEKDSFGHLQGGYATLFEAMTKDLLARGATIHLDTPVLNINEGEHPGCQLTLGGREGETTKVFDQVYFTGPSERALSLGQGTALTHARETLEAHPSGGTYLGVLCAHLVLRKSLTPYYILNLDEPEVNLTGVIEYSNLCDREAELGGLHLVFLPRYLPSTDPSFQRSDQELLPDFLAQAKKLFPNLEDSDIVSLGLERASRVQPLPIAGQKPAPQELPRGSFRKPFQILNTSLLACATLNNNEVLGLLQRSTSLL